MARPMKKPEGSQKAQAFAAEVRDPVTPGPALNPKSVPAAALVTIDEHRFELLNFFSTGRGHMDLVFLAHRESFPTFDTTVDINVYPSDGTSIHGDNLHTVSMRWITGKMVHAVLQGAPNSIRRVPNF